MVPTFTLANGVGKTQFAHDKAFWAYNVSLSLAQSQWLNFGRLCFGQCRLGRAR
jgi:hypothetical protein